MKSNKTLLAGSVAAFALMNFSAYAQTANDGTAVQPNIAIENNGLAATAVPGGQVVVEQAEPQVVVTQEDPAVTVDQAQPIVTVEQPQPEITVVQAAPTVDVEQVAPIITVQQAQPTVTVNIPQPIVTVQMPEPDVNVDVAQPQVAVQQPEPIIRFIQPEPRITFQEAEANVRVQQAEADVRINRAAEAEINIAREEADVNIVDGGDADVNVATAPAQVRVTEGADADINVNQAEADVRIQDGVTGIANTNLATEAKIQRDRMDVAEADAGANEYLLTLKRNPLYRMRVENIVGNNVFGERGENVGEIEDIALRGDKVYAIIAVGGFLGLGEHEVALPLERLSVANERVVLPNLDKAELEAMPEHNFRDANVLPRKRSIEYSVTRM
jgi:sporulation protein YlmC with PRC-barrel domain